MNTYSIYIVTSPSGKKYVGQAMDYVKRKRCHISSAKKKDGYPIYRTIRKYGDLLNWEEVMKNLSKQEADFFEIDLISRINTKTPSGYNCTDGAEGSVGFRHSVDSLLKMSIAHKGVTLSEEHKRKIGDSSRGKPTRRPDYKHSEKTKEAIGKSQQGFKNKRSKQVIDLSTGFVFDTVTDASNSKTINYRTLMGYLVGVSPNKTTLCYIE